MESGIKNNNAIEISIIVPVYNVEDYLSFCIDSLLQQANLCLEVILVNDGSTDNSGAIADQYAQQDSRIQVIHRENGGASAARNTGLELAQGEYIAFFDSDDWLKENSLYELFNTAITHRAEIVMGKIWYCYPDGTLNSPFRPAPKEMLNKLLSGKECFVGLVKSSAYPPMAYSYIFRRDYLEKIEARFEEGIMCEDELWTCFALCQAGRVVVIDHEFYYYRQQQDSVMHTTNLRHRLKSLFRVTDRLMEFARRFDFSGENAELKNWLYVHIFKIYSMTFGYIAGLRDSSVIIPEHHLDCFWRDCREMMPEPQKICRNYFQSAETKLKKYTDWRSSDWVASVDFHIKTGKKSMLIYNTIQGEELNLKIEEVPVDWVITTDRSYFLQADVVVFNLPNLYPELEDDLDKPEGQIWVSWYGESEENHALLSDEEIRDAFDIWICCKQDEEQKEHPLVALCRNINVM